MNPTIILAIAFIGLFVIGLALRVIFKGGEVRGSCATNSPFLQQTGIKCACGKNMGECETDQAAS